MQPSKADRSQFLILSVLLFVSLLFRKGKKKRSETKIGEGSPEHE